MPKDQTESIPTQPEIAPLENAVARERTYLEDIYKEIERVQKQLDERLADARVAEGRINRLERAIAILHREMGEEGV